MLYFDRIDASEGLDVNKTSESKEFDFFIIYFYHLSKGFKFQTNVCNRYHDLLMIFMNLNDIVILNIKPKNAGRGDHCDLPHPCALFKNVFFREKVIPFFFVTFNNIISHIFPENFIEIPQVVQKI